MKHFSVLAFVPLCALVANAALADTFPAPVQAVIDLHADDQKQQWAYTRETRDEEGHYVERFDPTLPRDQQWTLIEFEGKTPTKKALRRYQKHYEELFDRESPTRFDLESMLDPATMRLAQETDELLTYTFQPLAEDEEDAEFVAYLIGTVIISKTTNDVVSLGMRNKEEFSPMAMVKIKELSLNLTFERFVNTGPNFISRASSNTSGRLMGLKEISESEDVRYRDFTAL